MVIPTERSYSTICLPVCGYIWKQEVIEVKQSRKSGAERGSGKLGLVALHQRCAIRLSLLHVLSLSISLPTQAPRVLNVQQKRDKMFTVQGELTTRQPARLESRSQTSSLCDKMSVLWAIEAMRVCFMAA